jgi:hypothetical protein
LFITFRRGCKAKPTSKKFHSGFKTYLEEYAPSKSKEKHHKASNRKRKKGKRGIIDHSPKCTSVFYETMTVAQINKL